MIWSFDDNQNYIDLSIKYWYRKLALLFEYNEYHIVRLKKRTIVLFQLCQICPCQFIFDFNLSVQYTAFSFHYLCTIVHLIATSLFTELMTIFRAFRRTWLFDVIFIGFYIFLFTRLKHNYDNLKSISN